MQLSEVAVCSKNSEGGFVLEAKANRRLRILGSSLPHSGMLDMPVSFANFCIAKGGEGLIVLTVIGDGRYEPSFAVHVSWPASGASQPQVNLDARYAPRPNRLFQVTQVDAGIDSKPARLEVTLENGVIAVSKQRYSIHTSTVCDPERNCLLVPDTDLLCRYLIGDADLPAIEAYAEGWAVEAPARVTLAQVKRELEETSHMLRNVRSDLVNANSTIKDLESRSGRRSSLR